MLANAGGVIMTTKNYKTSIYGLGSLGHLRKGAVQLTLKIQFPVVEIAFAGARMAKGVISAG